MSTTWTHIIQAFNPDYDELRNLLTRGPIIRCELSKKGRETRLLLVEHYEHNNEILDVDQHTVRFDDIVFNVQEELKNWTNVRRMAWDQWNFKYKKDAEKFVTLFNLKWAK